MRILITGIKGFLGRNLVDNLREHELFGLGTKEEIVENITVFSSNDLDKLDLDMDLVIMCHAAVASGNVILSNDILYNVNVSLTEKIVTKFAKASIIYVSTTSIYDINSESIKERSSINPQSSYALSKLWAERVVLLHKKFIILRISSMFGIGMKENTLIPNYINQALKEKRILVWGKGERFQNYVHVEDVVKYVRLLITFQEKLYSKVLLGISKKEYSNLEIAKIISSITNTEIDFVNQDNSKSVYYNNDITTGLLNWEPKISVEERLQKYIEWKQKKY